MSRFRKHSDGSLPTIRARRRDDTRNGHRRPPRDCATIEYWPASRGHFGQRTRATATKEALAAIISARSVDRLHTIYFFGATPCLGSFGLGCIPGGESPWGLDAGAPPDVVLIGPE